MMHMSRGIVVLCAYTERARTPGISAVDFFDVTRKIVDGWAPLNLSRIADLVSRATAVSVQHHNELQFAISAAARLQVMLSKVEAVGYPCTSPSVVDLDRCSKTSVILNGATALTPILEQLTELARVLKRGLDGHIVTPMPIDSASPYALAVMVPERFADLMVKDAVAIQHVKCSVE